MALGVDDWYLDWNGVVMTVEYETGWLGEQIYRTSCHVVAFDTFESITEITTFDSKILEGAVKLLRARLAIIEGDLARRIQSTVL